MDYDYDYTLAEAIADDRPYPQDDENVCQKCFGTGEGANSLRPCRKCEGTGRPVKSRHFHLNP